MPEVSLEGLPGYVPGVSGPATVRVEGDASVADLDLDISPKSTSIEAAFAASRGATPGVSLDIADGGDPVIVTEEAALDAQLAAIAAARVENDAALQDRAEREAEAAQAIEGDTTSLWESLQNLDYVAGDSIEALTDPHARIRAEAVVEQIAQAGIEAGRLQGERFDSGIVEMIKWFVADQYGWEWDPEQSYDQFLSDSGLDVTREVDSLWQGVLNAAVRIDAQVSQVEDAQQQAQMSQERWLTALTCLADMEGCSPDQLVEKYPNVMNQTLTAISRLGEEAMQILNHGSPKEVYQLVINAETANRARIVSLDKQAEQQVAQQTWDKMTATSLDRGYARGYGGTPSREIVPVNEWTEGNADFVFGGGKPNVTAQIGPVDRDGIPVGILDGKPTDFQAGKVEARKEALIREKNREIEQLRGSQQPRDASGRYKKWSDGGSW